jgi:nicotinamidase-related amidase
MLHHFGVREGRISMRRFVELVSTNPARFFGMYPRKGTIAVGSDADIVVFDPEKRHTISAGTHHSNIDYNLYEGTEVVGAPEVVLVRGQVIVENDELVGEPGAGRFVSVPASGRSPMSDDTREVYERARLGQSVTPGSRPAVLVVDFSRGFTDPESTMGSDLTEEVGATNRLLAAARERRIPVIFTTIGFEANLKDGSLWLQKAPGLAELQVGGKWVEIDPRLERREDEVVILKKGASAFFGTNLPSVLVSENVDTLVLCGATTSGCIRATAVDLLQYGYPTLVPRECVGDRARAPHEANLVDIQAKYADVVSVEDALSYLERVGGMSAP